jgi:hypothetical protein
LRLFRNLRAKTPAILVTHIAPDLDLKGEINSIGYVLAANESDDGIKGIADAAGVLLKGQSTEQRLTITFVQQEDGKSWYVLLGETPSGYFAIDKDQLKILRERSRRVGKGDYPNWINTLSDVGKTLTESIFNPSLKLSLMKAVEDAGGVEETRVLFKPRQAVHEIALEALLEPKARPLRYEADPKEDVPFWMLRAPVYRRVDVSGMTHPRLPLFEDRREKINCLLIEAPTSGQVSLPDGTTLDLPMISNVETECQGIEKLLKKDPSLIGGGEVCRLSAKMLAQGESFRDRLEAKLKEREWHIVHFAGHSYYARKNSGKAPGKGYVFLPGNPIEPVSVSLFASWIKDAQLVFLTSCHSSEENFVAEMARNEIPAVIGFRWDLEDRSAAEFVVESFYPNLFGLRSIEKAFQAARIDAYKKHREETVWAAPMLIVNEQSVQVAA